MENIRLDKNSKMALTIGLLLLIGYWSFKLFQPPSDGLPPWIFLDNLNLLIHEAGHWLFMPFGEFMHILGGSLNQCLFPTIFLGYFIYRRDWLGSAFSLFWLGDNLSSVSYYIGDTQAMALPLLGGDTSGHDWHNLFTMVNHIEWADPLGYAVRISGQMCLVGSIAILLFVIFQIIASPKPNLPAASQ